jgi:hypothetical protein
MIDIAFQARLLLSADASELHAKVHEKQSNVITER